MTQKRYSVKDYYIWDNKDKSQVILFNSNILNLSNAKKVCELLNEHEAMKSFFINVAEALKEVN